MSCPNTTTSREPRSIVEKWAYFFREASHLTAIPPALAEPPLTAALEAARTAHFTEEEWDAYIRAGIALQDGRGALSLARKEGRREGLREGIEALCEVLGLELPQDRRAEIDQLDAAGLEALFATLVGVGLCQRATLVGVGLCQRA